MAALRCRPGDLARIVGTNPILGINDKIVRLADAPATLDARYGLWEWKLEHPLDVTPSKPIRNPATGAMLSAGDTGEIAEMPDDMLRPIRDPGDDAVDETLIYAGDPRVREVTA